MKLKKMFYITIDINDSFLTLRLSVPCAQAGIGRIIFIITENSLARIHIQLY